MTITFELHIYSLIRSIIFFEKQWIETKLQSQIQCQKQLSEENTMDRKLQIESQKQLYEVSI